MHHIIERKRGLYMNALHSAKDEKKKNSNILCESILIILLNYNITWILLL